MKGESDLGRMLYEFNGSRATKRPREDDDEDVNEPLTGDVPGEKVLEKNARSDVEEPL